MTEIAVELYEAYRTGMRRNGVEVHEEWEELEDADRDVRELVVRRAKELLK